MLSACFAVGLSIVKPSSLALMAPRRTSVRRSKPRAWHVLLVAGSIWSCHCFASLWEDLFSSPDHWVDCRADKKTRQFPDFKREKDGKALWINNEETPAWVEERLNEEGNLWKPPSSKDDLWQDLIDSPHEWEDFRTKKRNPRFPDFKRKEDGMSLWFDSYDTPDWVGTKLMEMEDKLATSSSSTRASSAKEHLWQGLIDSPHEWEDFRTKKRNPRFPDFKRKEDGMSLWFDSYDTPDWVATKLMEMEDKLATSSSSTRASSAKEHLWQDLIDSPHEWEDFRTKKRNPRFPDFKRKEDGMSLWFDSHDTPDWVATKLMEMEDKLATSSSSTRASSAKEHLWQGLIDSPHEWEDFRTKKRSPRFPDFKHKEDEMPLWLDSYDTPDWVATKLMEMEDKLATSSSSTRASSAKEHLWQDLIDSPHEWEDFRTKKRNPRFPDFKRKEDGMPLWFDSYDTPDWVATKLMEIEDKLATSSSSTRASSAKEHLWQDLIDSPHEWEDFRTKKRNPRFPDFKRKEDGMSLWFDSHDTPDWVATKLMEMEDKLATSSSSTRLSSAKEHLWQDLIDSPHEWEDFRTKKRNPRFPDFKRKEDGMSLWFDSHDTPDWVATKLMEMEDKLATSSSSTRASSAKEHLWQGLIDSPHEWEDFRTKKRSPRFPDFRHKEDEMPLWLDSYDTPDWVATKLMEIEDKLATPESHLQECWKIHILL